MRPPRVSCGLSPLSEWCAALPYGNATSSSVEGDGPALRPSSRPHWCPVTSLQAESHHSPWSPLLRPLLLRQMAAMVGVLCRALRECSNTYLLNRRGPQELESLLRSSLGYYSTNSPGPVALPTPRPAATAAQRSGSCGFECEADKSRFKRNSVRAEHRRPPPPRIPNLLLSSSGLSDFV